MYKLDSRFNKPDLHQRVTDILDKKDKIHLTNLDALDFLKKLTSTKKREYETLVYLDPPYYAKGQSLYLKSYKHDNHTELRDALKLYPRMKWLLSYDNEYAIQILYKEYKCYNFRLSYSAQNKRIGTEFLTHSKELKLPASLTIRKYKSSIPLTAIN